MLRSFFFANTNDAQTNQILFTFSSYGVPTSEVHHSFGHVSFIAQCTERSLVLDIIIIIIIRSCVRTGVCLISAAVFHFPRTRTHAEELYWRKKWQMQLVLFNALKVATVCMRFVSPAPTVSDSGGAIHVEIDPRPT